MMAVEDVFHVAATEQPATGEIPLQIGARFELEPPPAIYGPGVGVEFGELFEAGVTRHGKQYMAEMPANPEAWPNWAAELFFEAVRRADFKDRPSRMQSIFGFESAEDAKAFIGAYRTNMPCAIYRIRGEVAHRGNMSLLQMLGASGVIAFQLARSYWRGEQGARPACWELLLAAPAEVIDLVEPIVQ